MRFIIFGLGAVGGTFAAALAKSGHEVVGIARGAMLEAVKANGLLFRTPQGSERVRFAVVATPAEIAFVDGDIVMLTMKSQDTADALVALRDAGFGDRPVICARTGGTTGRRNPDVSARASGQPERPPPASPPPGGATASARPRTASPPTDSIRPALTTSPPLSPRH